MNNKLLIFLFMLGIGIINFSTGCAKDPFVLLGSTDKSDYYLDTSTLSVTKDEKNQIYYDTWIKIENKQALPTLNYLTKQYMPSKLTIMHIVFVIAEDKKTAQLWSTASYTQNHELINTYTPVEHEDSEINTDSNLFIAIDNYISQMDIKPVAVSNEKYLPFNEKEFYNFFETRGYKINKIDKVEKNNPINGCNYASATTPYSFWGKVIEKEVYLHVAGEDNQHLKKAGLQFALEGPNYEKATKKFSLPSIEKLDLFYMLLQVLFPDWPKENSKKWIDDSITLMNQKNTLVFIYLHKGRDYVMISRQPVQGNEIVLFVLEVSQRQPVGVNPFHPYEEKNNSISIYQEWKDFKNQ